MTNEESKQIIASAKSSIKLLSIAQDNIYEEAKQKLNLPKSMEDWLFDYLFNEHEEGVSFDDYLVKFNQKKYHNEL